MANKKSAKKAIRQVTKRRAANRSVRSTASTFAKKALAAIHSGIKHEAQIAINAYESFASKAGRRNIISKYTVSRKISRLNTMLKKLP